MTNVTSSKRHTVSDSKLPTFMNERSRFNSTYEDNTANDSEGNVYQTKHIALAPNSQFNVTRSQETNYRTADTRESFKAHSVDMTKSSIAKKTVK